MRGLFLAALFWASSVSAVSDTLELRNGDRITGHIRSMDEDHIVVETEYGVLEIDRLFVVSGALSPEKEIPKDMLLFHYDFEGNFLDTSGNGHIMQEHGGVTFVSGPSGPEFSAAENSAAYADGSGQYLEISATDATNAVDTFSLSFWIRLHDAEKFQFIVSKWASTTGTTADGKFALSHRQGNLTLYVVDETGTFHSVSARTAVLPDVWTHIAIVVGQETASIYVAGEPAKEAHLGFTLLYHDTSPIHFLTASTGTNPDWARYNVVGAIDGIWLFGRQLTPDEIQTLAESL